MRGELVEWGTTESQKEQFLQNAERGKKDVAIGGTILLKEAEGMNDKLMWRSV